MGPVYRQAASRLCVSPGMVERHQAWFGSGADVLYPSRGEDSPEPRLRVRCDHEGPPVVAYCGLIHQVGTAVLLRELAAVLATMNGRLDFYGPYSADVLAANWGLTPPVVWAAGFFPAAEMGERVGCQRDGPRGSSLPASFEPREREDVSTLFPSKLADYTAIGLPVLVWGPGYSSAARWAAENPGATVCITDHDPTPVKAALNRLVGDPVYTVKVAMAGIQAGNRDFRADGGERKFLARDHPNQNDPMKLSAFLKHLHTTVEGARSWVS